MYDKEKVQLRDTHRRSLSVISHHIENSLDDIEAILTGKRSDKVTEKIIKNMRDEDRNKILVLTKIVREQNEKMFIDLGLNSNEIYEDRVVRSRIGHIWTLLCDSTPEKLRGYGEATEEQGEKISAHVNEQLETVNKIQAIIFKDDK